MMITDLKNILLTIMMVWAAALVSSCSDDDSLASRGLETVEMPISISIPAEGFVNPTDVGIGEEGATPALVATRALGDPGTYEKFALPKYLYIYLVSTTTTNTTQVIFKKEVVKPEDWKLSTLGDNTNDHFSSKDGLYVYQGHLSINLPLNRKEGRVYVAASNIDLDDSSTNNKIKLVTSAEWTDEETFLNAITFSNDGELRKNDNMKNLYSSPYNLTKEVNSKDVYYGTIEDYASNVPHIDMVLYHVATKVDLQWTIDDDVQGTSEWTFPASLTQTSVDLNNDGTNDKTWSNDENMNNAANDGKAFFSLIQLRVLPRDKIRLFKPMGNYDRNSNYYLQFMGLRKDMGFKINSKNAEYYNFNEGDESVNPGTKWIGRSVLYVVPQLYSSSYYDNSGGDKWSETSKSTYNQGDDNYYLHLMILTNNYTTCSKDGNTYSTEDHATHGHNTYIKIDSKKLQLGSDNKPVFAPWIRVSLHVTRDNVSKVLELNNSVTFPVTL